MKIDIHADTAVMSIYLLIIQGHDQPVIVTRYDPKYGSKVCQTITGDMLYIHWNNWQVYMIVYNKAMHLDNLHNNCVYPIQCCMNGISVNRVPEFLADNPDYSKNVLLVDEPLDNEVPLITPLYLISVAIYYPVINPIIHESNDDPITHTHVTAEEPLWDP